VQNLQFSRNSRKPILAWQSGKGEPVFPNVSNNPSPFRNIRAFKGYLRTYRKTCKEPVIGYVDFMSRMKPYVSDLIVTNLKELSHVKVQITVRAEFARLLDDNNYEYIDKFLNGYMTIILNPSTFTAFFEQTVARLKNIISLFEQYGSGWKLSGIKGMGIRLTKFKLFNGKCWLPIPVYSKSNKIVNVKNSDDKCFQWAIWAALHAPPTQKNVNRPSSYYSYLNNHSFDDNDDDDINYPVTIDDIEKFKETNHVAVNIFYCDSEEKIIPFHVSKYVYNNDYRKAYILKITHLKVNHGHFAAIKDIDSLFRKSSHRKKLCFNCFQRVESKGFDIHYEMCKDFKLQKVTLPMAKPENNNVNNCFGVQINL